MSRTLTGAIETEVGKAVVSPILLAKFSFPTGDLNVWTGYGTLTFGGDIYIGTGDRGAVSAVQEIIGIRAPSLSFELSGIAVANLSLALTTEYQGRACKMWLGFLSNDSGLIPDPVLIFSGKMDTMTIHEGGDTASIRLSAENDLIVLSRVNERRYTPEDHKKDFPEDTIFDHVIGLQDTEVQWG